MILCSPVPSVPLSLYSFFPPFLYAQSSYLLAVPLYPLFLYPFAPLFPPSRYAQYSYSIAHPPYRLFLNPFIPLFSPVLLYPMLLFTRCSFIPSLPMFLCTRCSSVPLYLLSLRPSVFGLTPWWLSL